MSETRVFGNKEYYWPTPSVSINKFICCKIYFFSAGEIAPMAQNNKFGWKKLISEKTSFDNRYARCASRQRTELDRTCPSRAKSTFSSPSKLKIKLRWDLCSHIVAWTFWQTGIQHWKGDFSGVVCLVLFCSVAIEYIHLITVFSRVLVAAYLTSKISLVPQRRFSVPSLWKNQGIRSLLIKSTERHHYYPWNDLK